VPSSADPIHTLSGRPEPAYPPFRELPRRRRRPLFRRFSCAPHRPSIHRRRPPPHDHALWRPLPNWALLRTKTSLRSAFAAERCYVSQARPGTFSEFGSRLGTGQRLAAFAAASSFRVQIPFRTGRWRPRLSLAESSSLSTCRVVPGAPSNLPPDLPPRDTPRGPAKSRSLFGRSTLSPDRRLKRTQPAPFAFGPPCSTQPLFPALPLCALLRSRALFSFPRDYLSRLLTPSPADAPSSHPRFHLLPCRAGQTATQPAAFPITEPFSDKLSTLFAH